jgi:hypothetical protein
MKLKKNNHKTDTKYQPSQPEPTDQTCDPDYKTKITSLNTT